MKGAWGSNQRKPPSRRRQIRPAPGETAAPQPQHNDHSSNSDNVMDTSKKKAKIGRTQVELIHCNDVTVIDDVPERRSYENQGRDKNIKKLNSDNIVDVSKNNNVSRRSNGFDRTIDFKQEIVDADAPSPESNILEVLQEFDISNVETKILFESDEEDSKSNLNVDASVNNNVEIVDVKNFDSHNVISQEIRQEPTCDQPSETCRESGVIQNSHASDGKTEADTKENGFDNIADGSYALKLDPNKSNSNLQDKDLTMDINDDINNECCCENTVARNAETKPDDKDHCLNDIGKGSFLDKTDINETKSLIENDMNENSSLPKCVFDIGKSFAEEKTYCENYFLKVDETEDRRVLFSVGVRNRRKLSSKNLVNDARIRKFVRNTVSEIEENNGNRHKISTDRKLLMHSAVVMKKTDDQLLRELFKAMPHQFSTLSPPQLSPRKRFRPSCFTTILSPTFRKKNIKLLNLCKPCVVLLKRLESHKRMARRIELLDIEDVRRNNRSMLFAEVAPLTSCPDELSSPESPRSSSDEEWTPDIADPPAPLRHKSLASLGQAHIDNTTLATATTIVGQKGISNRHKTKKLPWPFTTCNQVGLNNTTKQLLRHLLISRNLRKNPQAPINSSRVQDTASQAASEPSKISFSSLPNFTLNQAVPVLSNLNPSIIDPKQQNYITIQPQTQLNLQQHPTLDVAQVVQKGVQNSKAPVQFSVTNSMPQTQYITPQNCPQSAIVAGLKGQPTFVPQDTTTQTTNMSTIVNIPIQHNAMVPGLIPTQGIQGTQENVTLNQIGAVKIPREITLQRLNSTKAVIPSQPNTMVLACKPTRSQENPLQNQQMGAMQMSQNISSQRDNSTMSNIPNQTNIIWSAQVQNAMNNQTNMLMNQEMKALQMKKEISQKVNAPTLINIANQPHMMMTAQVQNTILNQGSTMTQPMNVLQKPQEILQRNSLTITNNPNQTSITMTPQVQNAVRDQAGIMNQQICASQMPKVHPMLDVAQVVQNRVQNSNAPVQNLMTNSMPQTQYITPQNCPQPAIVAGLKGQPTFVPQDTTTETTNMSTIVNIPIQHNAMMPGLIPTQGIQGIQKNLTLNQICAVKIPQEITLQRLNSTKAVIPSQPNTMVLACKPTRSQEKTLQNQQKSALQKVNTPTVDNISNQSNVQSAKFQNTVRYQKSTQSQQMGALQMSQNISLPAQVQNVMGKQTNMHMNQEMKDLQITEEISQKINAPTLIKISHQPNMMMTAQVQNTILNQGSTMTQHMNVLQKPQVISQRDNLTITNNPNQANITMTPRVQNAIRTQAGIINHQICTLQMPKEISSQIVYPTITNIPNQPNITQGGLDATGVMLNQQISAIQMPQDIPQGANSFAIPTIGAIPGQSTSSQSVTNASQGLMNQQINALKPASPINSIQANSAANSLVFAPILGPSGLPESWVINLVGPETNPIQNSLYPDINSTNTGCNSKPNLLNSMPNTMPPPAPWAVASERGVPYTTVNPSNIQGNTQVNLQNSMQSGLSQLTPMIVIPEQGSSDVSLNPSHTWSNPRPNLDGPMNNELLKPALTITNSTCRSINPLLQTTVPQGNSISANPMHVMGTSVNASQTNMPLLLQHNPMPTSLVQATKTPVNSLQASIQKAAEAPVKPKASLQKQKVPALIPYSKWAPLRVQSELDSMEFMKRLGWGTCVPSYEWMVGRDPNTLRVLCTPREACWMVGRCLVVSEAELPSPQFFVWALSPRVRLLLPPDDFTPVDAKETSTKDPEARAPPWLKGQTSGQHQKAEAKAPALPRLYLNDNAFQKLCDEPLTYAKLLVAVRSARACRAALARGAPLQLYDVETCQLYPVNAKPNNGEVQLSLCGAAEVTETLLSLGQQLNQLPNERLTGEMAQADFQKRKLQLLNPGADRHTNHINHIAAPRPFIKGASASAKDFLDLPDNQFLDIFRLPKARVELLTEELRPFLKNTKYPMYGMTLEKKVLLTLRFLATGDQQPTDAVRAGVGDVCASRAVAEVVAALNQHAVLQKYIKFPGRQERDEIRHRFMELYKLPGVIGVIDGMQVSTTPQTADEGAGSSHSLNVVIICDADLNILSMDATHDGLTHDAAIWARHPANKHLKALRAEGEDVWLLGDSGFPQHEVLMTPLPTPLDDASARYCERHARAHAAIVRCFAALRARWRCLVTQKLPYKPEVAAKIVNACALLHNIANRYEYKMEVPWQSVEVEEQEWCLAAEYDAKQEPAETFLTTASTINQKQALAEIERGHVARLRLIQYLSQQPVTT